MVSRSLPLSRFDNIRLHVEYVPLGSLRVTLRATKRHNARQLKKLADGINRVGFTVPVLVDDDLGIVSGHGRVEAAKLIGLDKVPVIRVAHLSKSELRLFAIFDNKIASEGQLDLDAVRLELEEIVLEAPELAGPDKRVPVIARATSLSDPQLRSFQRMTLSSPMMTTCATRHRASRA